MKSIIVGTAGHIDHGKTALVKALTGIDADRLEEEKRRGITIDLGFAHLELSTSKGDRFRFGFVDVPGHERFVRNMLAGAGGIDLVLLVIAADEGIKPQTREHFEICRLLGIQHGIVVLTKSDLVDRETLEVIRLELGDFLRGSFLENAPIVPVSALTGSGLDILKEELIKLASAVPSRDPNAIARLPIDRVFTMKGFGTVVTGTLIAGAIRKEDELEVFPTRKKVRVRGVQVHGKSEDRAAAGERTALNLAAVDKEELARGMTLASPGMLRTSTRFDVLLTMLPSVRPLKNGSRVHFHAFSSEDIATVKLYEHKQTSGTQAFAQIALTTPQLLFPGDRFIIRQFSPVITIGGGVVLDAFPPPRMKAQNLEFLNQISAAAPPAILKARVLRAGDRGVSIAQTTAESGWKQEVIESHLRSASEVVRLGNILFMKSRFDSLCRRITEVVEQFHKQNPLTPGISSEALHSAVGSSDSVFNYALDSLFRRKKLDAVDGLVRLSGRNVVMKDEEAESKRVIEQAFASAGLKVPALKDVLAGLTIDQARAQKLVALLLREKAIVRVSEDLVFHHSALAELRKVIVAQKSKSAKIDVGTFKELTGITRKYAIPLLEYLDRERVTKRVGDARVIL
jgi:selenocysteine-specific elongation factor